MSDIPTARNMLLGFAKTLPAAQRRQLEGIVHNYLFREPRVRQAPPKRQEITPDIRHRVHELAETDLHMWEIGQRLGINPGRVSEILNGKR